MQRNSDHDVSRLNPKLWNH